MQQTHWTYKGSSEFDIPDGAFGFIYQIQSLLDSKKYIGKKFLTAAKTTRKQVLKKDGTKTLKKKKSRVESNWCVYMGSCKPLIADIEKFGKENYQFEIICFGFTKGQVNTLEMIAQIKADVMIDDSYYNDAVGSGHFRGVKFTDQLKDIIRDIKI